jgi:hypothetical protein
LGRRLRTSKDTAEIVTKLNDLVTAFVNSPKRGTISRPSARHHFLDAAGAGSLSGSRYQRWAEIVATAEIEKK